jgi:hypothetical protein
MTVCKVLVDAALRLEHRGRYASDRIDSAAVDWRAATARRRLGERLVELISGRLGCRRTSGEPRDDA